VSLLLGIDIGTTGARAILVDSRDGRVVAGATREYPLHTPRPLWAEQDAEDWWRGAAGAVREALDVARRETGTADVRAVGLSGQMHGVVLVDGAGQPLGRSLIWCDGRPRKTYFAMLMSRQQTPKPARERVVAVPLWLRTRTSAPLNTPAFHMIAFAGGPTSSAGVP